MFCLDVIVYKQNKWDFKPSICTSDSYFLNQFLNNIRRLVLEIDIRFRSLLALPESNCCKKKRICRGANLFSS